MSKKIESKPTQRLTAEDRRRRRSQILFAIMAAILIISWIASMIAVL
jgi:predicted nucleic acid-binding Zn ribbon protein